MLEFDQLVCPRQLVPNSKVILQVQDQLQSRMKLALTYIITSFSQVVQRGDVVANMRCFE